MRLDGTPSIDALMPDLEVLVILEEEHLPSLPKGIDVDQAAVDVLVEDGIAAAANAALGATTIVARREAWTALAHLWLEPSRAAALSRHSVGQITGTVLNGEEISLARSRNVPELDLAYLSSRVA